MTNPKPGSTASWDWDLPQFTTIEVSDARFDLRGMGAARYFGQPDLRSPRSFSADSGTPFFAAAVKSNLA